MRAIPLPLSALEQSSSRALFLIVGIANTASVQYTYDKGNLPSVQRTNNGKTQTYGFTYDCFGNMLTAKVGSRTLTTNVYNNSFDQLVQQTYGNGDVASFTYDKLGRTKTATYDDGRVLTYVYNGEGRLHSLTETKGSSVTTYLYTYDSIGRLIYSEQKEGYSSVLRTRQGYNEKNQLTSQNWQMNGAAYSEGYTYNSADGSLNTMTTGVGTTLTMGYDGLRRLTSVTGGPVTRQYTYRDIDSTKTTMQVASVTSGGQRYGYTYDSMGNIATFSAPGKGTITYTYDNQSQLLSATGDTTYTYTYDGAGNILTANGHTYTYGDTDWKDLLTGFDGQAIIYDAIGNPTSYYNGTRWNFTWANGRGLATASDGTNSLSFAYDASGLRTSKTVNGTTYRYYYAGGKLMRMTWDTNTIDFFYDASGLPYALKYNGTVYYYITNLQGDVMKLVDASGNVVASYEYDPYGKVLYTTGPMADANPLRYRGYVYDQETGFYYLQSRYYDPTIGRFLNADGYASTGQGIIGHNTYTYCLNNPINNFDSLGEFTLSVVLGAAIGGAIAGAFIGTVSHLISSGINGTSVTASSLINAAATGAITGAIGAVGGAIGGTAAVFASVAVGIFSGTVTAINTDGPILRKIVSGLTATMVAGFGTYYGTQFPVALNNPFTSGVTSFSGGLFTGMQTEIVNVATQQLVPKLFQNSNSDFNRDLIRVRETIRNQSPFTNRALLY